jgi:hypothetical protein
MIGQFVFEGALWLADLDGIEVRRVGRQVQQLAAYLFDQIHCHTALMRGEIVHNDNLPRR